MATTGPLKSPTPFRESPRSRAAKSLQSWIRDGVLRLGERVPAERALAEHVGVSRVTIRAVLRQLEADGLIRTTETGARVVAGLAPESTTVLANAVVIIGEPIQNEQVAWQAISPGYDLAIQLGAMGAIQASGRNVLVLHPDRLATPEAVKQLARERPLGVIFIRRTPREGDHMQSAEALVAEGVPVVAHGYEEEFASLDTVASDQEAGAYELARWLISRGRHHILCLSPGVTVEDQAVPAWYKRRYAGYERAMREAGLTVLPPLKAEPKETPNVARPWDHETSARVTAGFLVEYIAGANPPDAIMATSDGPANTVMAALRLFGKNPGRDILVTGYDHYWVSLPDKLDVPPSATVDKLNAECGRALAELLFERAAGKLAPETPEHRLRAPRLLAQEM